MLPQEQPKNKYVYNNLLPTSQPSDDARLVRRQSIEPCEVYYGNVYTWMSQSQDGYVFYMQQFLFARLDEQNW